MEDITEKIEQEQKKVEQGLKEAGIEMTDLYYKDAIDIIPQEIDGYKTKEITISQGDLIPHWDQYRSYARGGYAKIGYEDEANFIGAVVEISELKEGKLKEEWGDVLTVGGHRYQNIDFCEEITLKNTIFARGCWEKDSNPIYYLTWSQEDFFFLISTKGFAGDASDIAKYIANAVIREQNNTADIVRTPSHQITSPPTGNKYYTGSVYFEKCGVKYKAIFDCGDKKSTFKIIDAKHLCLNELCCQSNSISLDTDTGKYYNENRDEVHYEGGKVLTFEDHPMGYIMRGGSMISLDNIEGLINHDLKLNYC